MCDVVSGKMNKKPGDCRVCVCACLDVDRVSGWKKYSNQHPGTLPDCFTNVSLVRFKESTEETQEEENL